jgi:ribosomal protein S18 acetylase RimI-like enzyme
LPVITTRPAAGDDGPLLLELFVNGEAGLWAQLSPVDSTPVLRRMFEAQQAEYARQYPDARHDIVLIDGAAAGQVHWAESDEDVHVIDVGVLPRYRRHGVASTVYARLVEHARGVGKPVRSMVTRTNAASLAFHRRAGFAVESENETHYFLVCR